MVDGGSEPIERLRRQGLDLVLLDLAMADPDGLEVYAWIVTQRSAMVFRTAFLTGTVFDAEAVEAARVEHPFAHQMGRWHW